MMDQQNKLIVTKFKAEQEAKKARARRGQGCGSTG